VVAILLTCFHNAPVSIQVAENLLRFSYRIKYNDDDDGGTVVISSDGGDSGSKKCKRSYGGVYNGVWRSVRLAGVWGVAVGFVLMRLVGI
jgi:hypothetical protein